MDALIQKLLYLLGSIAVTFGAAYGLYSLWEEHTATGRCFAAERQLEQHRFGADVQKALNLVDAKANRERALQLCFKDDGACFDGYAADIQQFCNAEKAAH